MKNIIIMITVLLLCNTVKAQELFSFTEPASNMAAKSIGVRLNNYFMKDIHENKINYHVLPEVMVGLSKKIMIHAEAFLSNRDNKLTAEGGGFYMKYRFYSSDDIHSHFRLATYGRYSFNNTAVHQPAIDLLGHNSGYEIGIVATKLINKVAISSSISTLHASDNGSNKFIYGNNNRNAVNYTLSVGKLLLPKEYTSYKQTNVNAMLELLGQTNVYAKESFLDIAPVVQFIINSRLRIDAGYRIPINTKLHRTAAEGGLLRIEYNFFNVFK
ncbi:MAG: hypothetical protein KA319_13500 [Ferruginibacter sp.]|nr:hypothetical protein [Ferruginibacter sp.]